VDAGHFHLEMDKLILIPNRAIVGGGDMCRTAWIGTVDAGITSAADDSNAFTGLTLRH